MTEISFYRHPISQPTAERTISLEKIYELIKSSVYRDTVYRIRREPDREKRQEMKCEQLDYVTFSGIFRKRKHEELERHTGLFCMDYDHLGTIRAVAKMRTELEKERELDIQMMFVSPSGDGLKVIVRDSEEREGSISELEAWHKQEYRKIAHKLEEKYGLKCDKTNDIARACFLSWDRYPYYKPAEEARKKTHYVKRRDDGGWKSMENKDKIEYTLRKLEESGRDVTQDYKEWVRIGFGLANEFGEEGREYFHRLSRMYKSYKWQETEDKYSECLRTNTGRVKLGTVLWLLWKVL